MAVRTDESTYPRMWDECRLRPEARVVLLCARLRQDEDQRSQLKRELSAELDWSYLLDLAERHSLLPLLHKSLREHEVPKRVATELWASYEHNLHRNVHMVDELLRVLRDLDQAQIPALPYKGPTLTAAVYGDLGLREFGDLDILVPKQHLLRAKQLLETQGFSSDHELSEGAMAVLLRGSTHKEICLIHEGRDVVVELHWKTDNDSPVERAEDSRWWNDLARTEMSGYPVRRFASHELLMVLCLHGSQHHWGNLNWLVDIAELIRQEPQLEWDWIRRRARELRVERRLWLGVFLARELLQAPLPTALECELDRPAVVRSAQRILASLFLPQGTTWSHHQRLLLHWGYDDNLRQRIARLGALLQPSLVELSRWPLPKRLTFLYSPLRIARLSARFASSAVRRSRR